MIKRIILALGLITLVSAPAHAQSFDFGSLTNVQLGPNGAWVSGSNGTVNVGPGGVNGVANTGFGTFTGSANQAGVFGTANGQFGSFSGGSNGQFNGTVFGPGGGVNVNNNGASGWFNGGFGSVSGSTGFGGGGFAGGGVGDVSKSGGTGDIGASHDNLYTGEGMAGSGPNAVGVGQTVPGNFQNMLGSSNQAGTNEFRNTNIGAAADGRGMYSQDDMMRLGDHPNPMSVLQVNPMQPTSVFQGQQVGTMGLAPVFGW